MLRDPEMPCPCGSERTTGECCAPAVAPVSAEPVSYSDLEVGLYGLYGPGWRGPLPANHFFELRLNQPLQLDPGVEKLTDGISSSISPLLRDDQQVPFKDLLENLDHALHAVRYHQRQYLSRLRIVLDRHSSIQGTRSEQVSFVFDDYPLVFEMEALVSRFRAALDAAAQLLALCLGQKPKKYGDLAAWIQRQTPQSNPLAAELRDLFNEHDAWVKRVTHYRHGVAHEGRMKEHKSVGYGAHGVVAACVAEEDAAKFVVTLWPKLLRLLDELFSPLRNRAARARSTDQAPKQD
jgi:hypothetical protein